MSNFKNPVIPLYYQSKEDLETNEKGVYLGNAIQVEDGYYYYQVKEPCVGLFEAWALKYIADKLDELNKEWDEQIQRDLGDGR